MDWASGLQTGVISLPGVLPSGWTEPSMSFTTARSLFQFASGFGSRLEQKTISSPCDDQSIECSSRSPNVTCRGLPVATSTVQICERRLSEKDVRVLY